MLCQRKGSIISDQRSAISDQTTFDTKLNTSTYVVEGNLSLDELSKLTQTSSSAILELNPSLNNLSVIPNNTTVLLPNTSSVFDATNAVANQQNLPELNTNTNTETASALAQTPVAGYVTDDSATNLANASQTVATTNWNAMSIEDAQIAAENYAKSQARQQLLAPVQEEASKLLGQFGKADVRISIDDEGSLKDSGFNLLSPWLNAKNDLIFTQVGLNGKSDTFIGNFGLGYRHDEGKYLFGVNTFIDSDFENQHTRGGFGLEFWTEPARFSGNYYYPISNWRDADELEGYEARPAKGFDLRAQAYLPSYPQIGGSLMYEQYFGDEVALFGKDNLQNDPSAYTVGLDYTPVPLITVKGAYKEGQNNLSEGIFDVQMNIQLGTSIEDQLNPDNVALARSLAGSRYDTVDRNYDIVLEYREKNYAFTLDFTKMEFTVDPNSIIELVGENYLTINSPYPLDGAPLWIQSPQDESLFKILNKGSTNPNDWKIQVPPYINTKNVNANLRTDMNGNPLPMDQQNKYELDISIKDIKGKTAHASKVTFIVTPLPSSAPLDYPSTNLAIEIYDNGQTGKVRGALVTSADATLPDHYYEVVIKDKGENGDKDVDVTAYFAKYIRWTYFDANNLDSTIDFVDLERCDGTVMFPTQITNQQNVEQVLADISQDPSNPWFNFEQGLALIPTIELPDDIKFGTTLLTKQADEDIMICNDNNIYPGTGLTPKTQLK